MKNIHSLLLALFCSSLIYCCTNSTESDKQKSTKLNTIKTLGLAYLEEFKFEEAEKEFLRFIDLAPDEKLGYANLGLTYLRMGKFPEAEKQLLQAIKIDPKDPDIRLILATVYRMNDEPDRALAELKEALVIMPNHIKSLYDLSELYATQSDEKSQKEREVYLQKLVEYAPANIVPRLNLLDIYIRRGDADKSKEQLELVKKLFPEFPKEAKEYYDKTLSFLRKSDKDNAILSFTIFHNYLKVSSSYQAGMIDLKGPGGSLIGFPVITFDLPGSARTWDNASTLDMIKFSDASASAGLDIISKSGTDEKSGSRYLSHVVAADYDGDGDIDLYAGSYDQAASAYRHYLFRNELGRFTDVSHDAGLRHTGNESAASFMDFDNDGWLDLYIVREAGDILYRNTGKGRFEDNSKTAKTGGKSIGRMVLCFDADQDGDLDIYRSGVNSNLLLRNNSDGTFLEQAERMGLKGNNLTTTDAAFGDYDEDGDLDLVVVNENAGNLLLSNQRQGLFRDGTAVSGLQTETGSSALAVGDYNNDGFLDLFIASLKGESSALYRNLRNGRFEMEKSSAETFRKLQNITIHDVSFLDFDNDGYLDLFIAGASAERDSGGIFLFHNDGQGNFTDVSGLLPAEVKSGRQIALFDYNDDGDLDMAVAGLNGGVTLLRNDGGNNNHFIKMKLVGIRTGSAKNNYFGIGAKVEMRAGDLYNTMVVTDPNIHFGIGGRLKADVIRITWTNGVPQNMFFPETDQSIIESQVLKGSCPFLYTWNGDEYVFVKDIMWRSALGMPLGIMGGTTAYAFPDASDDYIKIPGENLKPRQGLYSIQVTSELWETIYFDKVQLVAVDHPDSVDVFVAEQFTPPPFPEGRVYQVKDKHLPVSASDDHGTNVLPYITKKDDKYLAGFKQGKYQGITEMHDLILDLGELADTRHLFLFLNGWIFPTDASINVALSQSSDIKAISPVIQVMNKEGEWETVMVDLGFPMGKDKTVIADLSGKITTADHRIRIRTNLEIYWDHIFFSGCQSRAPVVSIVLDPVTADLHFRGFSESYRKGGRYGPHWFDYARVSTQAKWRDLAGEYTRYGDVLPLLKESDNKYVISNAGDEASVSFSAKGLPALPKGWKRDFLIHSVGWVKDGDLNTAFGNTVLPLPFHGMKSYPPDPQDVYPEDPDHQKYLREYNTRVVSSDSYINALKQ